MAQPAFATCVYHGAAKICHDDKDWTPAVVAQPTGPEKDAPAEVSPSALKTIVMQPSASVDNAWVMIPEGSDPAASPTLVNVTTPACELGTTSC